MVAAEAGAGEEEGREVAGADVCVWADAAAAGRGGGGGWGWAGGAEAGAEAAWRGVGGGEQWRRTPLPQEDGDSGAARPIAAEFPF